jgi:hypothetical protein
MVAFLYHVPTHSKEPILQCLQLLLDMDPQNTLAEQAHQVVRQHDHVQRSLGTVKTVQVETIIFYRLFYTKSYCYAIETYILLRNLG